MAQKTSPQVNSFIENKGQVLNQNFDNNKDVLFLYVGKGLKIQLRKSGYSYELFSVNNLPNIKPNKKSFDDFNALKNVTIFNSRIDIDFISANINTEVIAETPGSEFLNYFTSGKEISNIKSFKKITYKNAYQNIDIEFTLTENDANPLKYNVILHPGADINQIKFLCKGANSIKRIENEIEIITPLGSIKEKIPFSYYTNLPEQNIAVDFKLADNIISFSCNYDKSKTLVIDPSSNIIWGTYFGGSAVEYCAANGIDAQNNLYIAGHTLSTSNIATNGVYQTTLNGNFDLFIAKLTSNGVLIWGTYFGGSNYETAYAMFVEPNGIAYVTGNSGSTSNVASIGAHQTVYGGGIDDATLIKFDANGQRLWSTYYGADYHDIGYCITKDINGDIIIGGHTESSNIANAIATPGAFATALAFGVDAFIAKFNSNGVRQWGTYYGDTGFEEAWGVTTDASSNVIITGFTSSIANIATPTSHQPFNGGNNDGFIAKFNSTGSNLIWATYYGGSGEDAGSTIDINSLGNIYVCGNAGSTSAISTPSCHQYTPGSSEDIFLACFNSGGVRQWGTYYGGDGSDYNSDILIDSNDNILICGQTLSTNSISTIGAYQPNPGLVNTYDAYFAKFSSAGKLILASYCGGAGYDYGKAIVIDNTNKLYLTGETNSTIGLATPGTHMPNDGGSGDAFTVKFCLQPEPKITPLITPTLCINDTYTLNATNGFVTYFWSNGIFGNPLFLPGPYSPGNYYYTVTVFDAFGCSGTSDSAKIIVAACLTGLNEITENEELNIFPVPATDNIYIENSFNDYEVQIYSIIGQLVLRKKIKSPENNIDIKSLNSGVYFLKINSSKNSVIKKFIKQ